MSWFLKTCDNNIHGDRIKRVFLSFSALGIREFCCLINIHNKTHSQAVKQQLSRACYTPLNVLRDV
jgi:hypothetical protein